MPKGVYRRGSDPAPQTDEEHLDAIYQARNALLNAMAAAHAAGLEGALLCSDADDDRAVISLRQAAETVDPNEMLDVKLMRPILPDDERK